MPVIFFPTDYPVDQAVVNHVNKIMKDIQEWYGWWNDGKTFMFTPAQVIAGAHNSYWYWCYENEPGCATKNIFENLNNELNAKGIGYLNPEYPHTIYALIIMGGGGIGGAWGFDRSGGGAVANIGDLSIYPELDKNCNRVKQYYFKGDPIDSKARCLNENMVSNRQGTGALAHELGHTFDLPHTETLYPINSFESQNSIMQNQGMFPKAILTPKEKDILKNNPFFTFQNNFVSDCPSSIHVCALTCLSSENISGYAACTNTFGYGNKCCLKVTNTPTSTKTPTLTKPPTPTSTKTPTPTKTPSVTAIPTLTAIPTVGIVCDPDDANASKGRIDFADLRLARRELSGIINTNKASCMNSPSTDSTKFFDLRSIRHFIAGF